MRDVEDQTQDLDSDRPRTQGDGAQPLINGPRGFCLDLTNPTGRTMRVQVNLPNGTGQTISIGAGDPVTGGPPSGRSRTAAQMVSLGFLTRDDVSSISFGV